MERIKVLLDHAIDISKLKGLDDIELCLVVLRGSIEKECVGELADKVLEFTNEKFTELSMKNN